MPRKAKQELKEALEDLKGAVKADLDITYNGRKLRGGTTEVVPDPPRLGFHAVSEDRVATLRAQYHVALEEAEVAAAKQKNAKQEREAAEETLVRARENAPLGFDATAELRAAQRLTDLLIRERVAGDRNHAAKKDLKAARIAYRNHTDG